MDGSAVLLLLRATVSLIVVLGLIVWASRVADRRLGGGRAARPDVPVTVLARQGLSRHASLSVVQVGQDVLVLGVTDGQVNLLTELDPAGLRSHAASDTEAVPQRAGGAPEPVDAVPAGPGRSDRPGGLAGGAGEADRPAERADFAAVLRSTVALPTRREVKAQGEAARTITDRLTAARNSGRRRD